jgi:hypothetical protein
VLVVVVLVTDPSGLTRFVIVVVDVVGVAATGWVRLPVPESVALVVVVVFVVVGLPCASVPLVLDVRGGKVTVFPFGQVTPFDCGTDPVMMTAQGSVLRSALAASMKLFALPQPAALKTCGQLFGAPLIAFSIC